MNVPSAPIPKALQRKITVTNLNTGLVRYSNGQKCPVVKWSSIQMVITQPKQPSVVRSLPFEYRTTIVSGIQVSGIQMVTVSLLHART